MARNSNLISNLARNAASRMPRWMLSGMYRLGPISQFIRKVLNRNLPEGSHFVEVASGPLQGLQLEVDLQSEKDYWLGSYEIALVEKLSQVIGEARIAYDVGANIGYISLALAQLMGPTGRVYAFEALPTNVEKLKRNIAKNEFAERVIALQKAIGDSSGKGHFRVHRSGFMGKLSSSEGRAEDYMESIAVETLALDEAIGAGEIPPPDLVKIDIEGGEGLALKGMRKLLQETKPLLLIELHGSKAAKIVFDELQAASYQVRNLKGDGKLLSNFEEVDWKAYIIAEAQK